VRVRAMYKRAEELLPVFNCCDSFNRNIAELRQRHGIFTVDLSTLKMEPLWCIYCSDRKGITKTVVGDGGTHRLDHLDLQEGDHEP